MILARIVGLLFKYSKTSTFAKTKIIRELYEPYILVYTVKNIHKKKVTHLKISQTLFPLKTICQIIK